MKKLINRAKALQEAERKKNTVVDNDNLKDDDSFNGENYEKIYYKCFNYVCFIIYYV